MADLQKCFEAATSTNHQEPPWMNNPYQPPPNLNQISQQAIDVFLQSQRPNGTMGGLGWWQTANAYTAIALKDLWTGDHHNFARLTESLHQCDVRRAGFVNPFTDDMLWWAMCCLHMFELSAGQQDWFLEKARSIFTRVRASGSIVQPGQVLFQGRDMKGACWWKTVVEGNQLSPISTALYVECALRLALLESKSPSETPSHPEKLSKQQYIDAARFSLEWLLNFRYRPQQGVMLDAVHPTTQTSWDWTFTYTTGVALASCALLYELTGQEQYLQLSIHMAWKSMRRSQWVEENGVLTEKGAYGPEKYDANESNDAVGFKAVLIRQLATLYDVIHRQNCQTPKARRVAAMIRQFININFQSQQERNTNGHGQYGPWWNGPYAASTSHSQLPVLDVMAAVMLVNR